MVSSIGYALGAGSGLDTAKLIEDLYTASRAPKEAAIKKREEANAARISGIAEASNAIASFSSALSSLVGGGTLFTQPTVSDTSVFSAKALPGSRLGDYSARLEVKQLAQAQTLVSQPLGAATDPVGQGTITLNVGGRTLDIIVDENNDSLEGLAKAINDKKAGVTATIVTGTQGAQIMLKGQTGEAQAFTLSVPEGTVSGLERFAFGPSVTNGLTQAQAARDAIVILDGVEVARDSNSISDLIPGIQLDLLKAAPGNAVAIGSQRPTGAIRQAVGDFIAAFNELNIVLNDLAGPSTPGQPSKPLRNDLGVRDMMRQLNRMPSTILSSEDGPHTLGDIGVYTNRDGTLSLDQEVFDRALKNHPDGVEALFNPGQHSSNPNLVITSALGKVKPGTYTITNVVPGVDGAAASGFIDGKAADAVGNFLIASTASGATGLVLQVKGAISSATITIDAGIGGALLAIKDALFAPGGPLTNSNTRFSDEAGDIADDREAMERRMTAYHDRLVSSYASMEKRVAVFKATQSYLDQQIKMWTKSGD
ncbi:flagellar filament capping protein FliD [Allosphingosinicella vermicomposti]|uniref:flagellar filament capping protein FliD n=1 Tax=Allosphingosinicella vermicomposti TaxID=614671 RepID=UPI001FE24087|nr:flagellar filament capping protein FliD [Allosphingosinicella vermicomposti]